MANIMAFSHMTLTKLLQNFIFSWSSIFLVFKKILILLKEFWDCSKKTHIQKTNDLPKTLPVILSPSQKCGFGGFGQNLNPQILNSLKTIIALV